MRVSAELMMLARIKNELNGVHDTVYRSWQGGKIPQKVDQRLRELESMIGFLNDEINFISRSRWKDDERKELRSGSGEGISGGGDSEMPLAR